MEDYRTEKNWPLFWLIILTGSFLYFFILDAEYFSEGIGSTVGRMVVPLTVGAAIVHFSKKQINVRVGYVIFILLIMQALVGRASDSRKYIVESVIEGCATNDVFSLIYPEEMKKNEYCECYAENMATDLFVDSLMAKALLKDRSVDFVSGGMQSLVDRAGELCLASVSP